MHKCTFRFSVTVDSITYLLFYIFIIHTGGQDWGRLLWNDYDYDCDYDMIFQNDTITGFFSNFSNDYDRNRPQPCWWVT